MMRRDMVKYAESLGWVNDGIDGRGHIALSHPVTGAQYRISATPSDVRAEQNERAALRRMSGNAQTSTTVRTAQERRDDETRRRRHEQLLRAKEANQRNRAVLAAERRRNLMAAEDNFRFFDSLMRSRPTHA